MMIKLGNYSKVRAFKELLVLFYAEWCGYCQRFKPVFTEVAGDCKCNCALMDISDEDDPLWDDLQIEAVPTMILYRNGEIIDRGTGALEKGDLKKFMRKNGLE